MATAGRCLREKSHRGKHRQNKYVSTYKRMMEIAVQQISVNVTESTKHWSWKEITAEEDGFGSRKSSEAVMGMLMTASNV